MLAKVTIQRRQGRGQNLVRNNKKSVSLKTLNLEVKDQLF